MVPRLLAVTLAALAAACASTRQPCAGPTCGAGYECVANVCEREGAEPVPPGSVRVVPELVDFVVMNRRGNRQPPTATLGGNNRGDMLLFLEFDDSWMSEADPIRAFLVLFPSKSVPRAREDVLLEAFTLPKTRPSWNGRVFRHPKRSRPTVRALARAGAPIRFDVTPLLRGLRVSGDDGIAVVAVNEDGDSATVDTIGEGGRPPLFEVYAEPKAK